MKETSTELENTITKYKNCSATCSEIISLNLNVTCLKLDKEKVLRAVSNKDNFLCFGICGSIGATIKMKTELLLFGFLFLIFLNFSNF